MFNRKSPHTPQELTDFITGIKTLEQLRNQAEQKSRLHKPEDRPIFQKEYEHYTQAIHTAQLCLNKMLTKVAK